MVGGIQISPSGACQRLSKSVHFGHRAGGSPLSPPGEIWVPRRSQTVIMVLEYPPNTLPRLGTVPDSLGDLERAGEREKLKNSRFLSKILDLERIWRIWERFGGFSLDFARFRRKNHSGASRAAPKHSESLLWDLYRSVGGVGRSWARENAISKVFRSISQVSGGLPDENT